MNNIKNLRHMLRQIRQHPGFAISVIGTLALGLGAAIAMFTVIDHVVLRPLPYENPDQIVRVNETGRRGIRDGAPFLDIQEWWERSHTLSDLALYSPNNHVSFLEGNSGAMQVLAPKVSGNLFALLGTHPAIGRTFEGDPQNRSVRREDAQTMILSDAAWRAAYGSDPNILGKAVKVNGQSYIVIGVMPRAFTFPFGGANPVVWTPTVLGDEDMIRAKQVTPTYSVIARVRPGEKLPTVEAELKLIQAGVSRAYTDPYQREEVASIHVQRYGDSLLDNHLRRALLALAGAAGLLWLIACVNVTSLLLARATVRQREVAVHSAMGASRGQIVLRFLKEGLFFSGIASLIGFGLSMLTLQLFERALKEQFNIHTKLTTNLTVMVVLLGLTVMSALLVSMWPALSATRFSIDHALRQGTAQSSSGRKQNRIRSMLVMAEIAMSLTLLVGCGLLLRTIYVLRRVPLGFRTDHVIVANMTIPAYSFTGRDIQTQLYQPLLNRVQHLPAVQSASLMTEVPLGKTFQIAFTFSAEGNSAADVRARNLSAQFRAVSPEMQRVLGFHMSAGRFFNEQDTAVSQPVIVLNRAFVKAYLGDDHDLSKILGETIVGWRC